MTGRRFFSRTSLESVRPGQVVRLVLASLLAGLVMHWTGWSLLDLLSVLTSGFGETVSELVSTAAWLLRLALTGAVIVVPVWLVVRLLRRDR